MDRPSWPWETLLSKQPFLGQPRFLITKKWWIEQPLKSLSKPQLGVKNVSRYSFLRQFVDHTDPCLATPESKMIQDWIRCAADDIIRADLHPRTSIQMILQELESDGHLLSPAINCLSCALLDSGIPLKSLMASSTAAIMPDGDVKLDPCHQVTKESKSLFTFVFDGVSASAISIKSEGAPFTRQELNTCHDLCRLKCKDIFGSLKEKIKQRLE